MKKPDRYDERKKERDKKNSIDWEAIRQAEQRGKDLPKMPFLIINLTIEGESVSGKLSF